MSGSSGSGPPVSIADSRSPSADHLARAQQDRLGDRDAECLGGLEVDNEFEMRRLLNRPVSPLEDLIKVPRGSAQQIFPVRALGQHP